MQILTIILMLTQTISIIVITHLTRKEIYIVKKKHKVHTIFQHIEICDDIYNTYKKAILIEDYHIVNIGDIININACDDDGEVMNHKINKCYYQITDVSEYNYIKIVSINPCQYIYK